MIHTLVTDLYLYKVHRYRSVFEIRMAGQRKAGFLIAAFIAASIIAFYFIIYG
jgi:hypothetical protein